MMMQTTTADLTVKASLNDQLRRFTIPTSGIHWDLFLKQLCSIFQVTPQELIIKYVDDEADLVNISSDPELQEAIKITTSQINTNLTLELSTTNSQDALSADPRLQFLGHFGFHHPHMQHRFMRNLYKDHHNKRDFGGGPFLHGRHRFAHLHHGPKDFRSHHWPGHHGHHRNPEVDGQQNMNMYEVPLDRTISSHNVIASGDKIQDLDSFPWEETSTLYLDGTNLMYMCSTLRNFVLNGESLKSEDILVSIAKEFGMLKNIPTVVLLFDKGQRDAIDFTLQNGSLVRLRSARPEMDSSADQLISWAKQDSEKESLFVTSDPQLSLRLQETGCKVAEPKAWLSCATKFLGRTDDQEVKSWLHLYFDRLVKDSEGMEV